MKQLGTLLVLGGYILVYAAVANGGRLAGSPWMGVFHDAYGVDSNSTGTGATTTTPSAGATAPPVRNRTPATVPDNTGTVGAGGLLGALGL